MTLDVKNEKLCEMVETPEKQSQDSCLGTAKMTVQMGFHSSCTDVTKSTFFFFFLSRQRVRSHVAIMSQTAATS